MRKILNSALLALTLAVTAFPGISTSAKAQEASAKPQEVSAPTAAHRWHYYGRYHHHWQADHAARHLRRHGHHTHIAHERHRGRPWVVYFWA
jgi:hypothetical protein